MQLRAIMDGDAALEAEMLAGFRTASVKEAAALRDALAKGDCTAIRHASHRMKGLARLVAALPPQPPARLHVAQGADVYQYDITVDGRTYRADDLSMPESWRALVDFVLDS